MTQPTPFHLTEVDRQVLSQTDDEFIPHDWDNLKDTIARNDLASLKRKPSDLVRYIAWSNDTKAQYGTITNYVALRRLGWQPPYTFNDPVPFADPADFRILRNDWPYGVAPGITHLIVWLRTPVPAKADGGDRDGDMTDEARELIDRFVRQMFVGRLEKVFPDDAGERVLWFKNWTALQSVRALEHVHVLVRDVSEDILVEWTGEIR